MERTKRKLMSLNKKDKKTQTNTPTWTDELQELLTIRNMFKCCKCSCCCCCDMSDTTSCCIGIVQHTIPRLSKTTSVPSVSNFSSCLLPWKIRLPSLQRLRKNPLSDAKFERQQGSFPELRNPDLQFVSCWLRTNSNPQDQCIVCTHSERTHTILGKFSVGMKKGFITHQTSLAPSLSLSACVCVCVCVLAESPEPLSKRENNTTFQLLHTERVWFGLDDNVPYLSDPEFKVGSYFDKTVSVYKTG